MPEFKSPISNRKFSGQQMKEVDIPDESGYSEQNNQNLGIPDQEAMKAFQARMQPTSYAKEARDVNELEKEMHEARIAKRSGKERLSDGAKRRIEILLDMTRSTRTVDIEGNIFILRTLRSVELRETVIAASEFDGTVQFSFETAKQVLARALVKVAGVDIEEFINSNKLEDKLIFIEELDQSLLTRLYKEYSLLNQESQDRYAIKDTADAQEVVEDLKK